MVARMLRLVAVVGALLALAEPALAIESYMPWSRMTYVCPSPLEIDLSWTPVDKAAFYSLQLVTPLDPSQNGGIGGTYLRQFGTIEVARGQITSANIALAPASLSPDTTALQWQVMLGGPQGYQGIMPRQQVAVVPVPCTQTTPLESPSL